MRRLETCLDERNTQRNTIADHAAKNFLPGVSEINTQKHHAALVSALRSVPTAFE
jgi:hypothetical protein